MRSMRRLWSGLSFDHLIGCCKDSRRNGEAESLGSSEVHDQAVGRASLDRQVAGLGTPQDAVDVRCKTAMKPLCGGTVADQTSRRCRETGAVDRREPVTSRQVDDRV